MTAKRALITGITGMDGSHMADLLLEKDYEVFGLVRQTATPNLRNLDGIEDKVTFIKGDLHDQSSLSKAMDIAQPDEVYNFAAQSYVGSSWATPEQTSDINALGVMRMLEAMRQTGHNVPFYQASSSEMFGAVQETPQNENTMFYPRSPYAVAKCYGYWIARNYRDSYRMHTINGICFNHESERRGFHFVTRKISRAVAAIHLNKATEIRLGNLDAKRDWGYAPDYMDAIWLTMQRGIADDYVIATGQSHSVKEFLTIAFKTVGIDDWGSYVSQDANLMRPAEVHRLEGDYSKLKAATGWEPTVKFEALVTRMVNHDIADIQKGD